MWRLKCRRETLDVMLCVSDGICTLARRLRMDEAWAMLPSVTASPRLAV